jgi:hypothetical protein
LGRVPCRLAALASSSNGCRCRSPPPKWDIKRIVQLSQCFARQLVAVPRLRFQGVMPPTPILFPSIPDAVQMYCGMHTAGPTTKSRRTSIQRSPGSSGFHLISAGEFNFQAPPRRILDDHEISRWG